MKKLLYSILALAGLTMASCTQEHIDVQYIPENAVAPTLGDIQGCELQDGGADIVVEYTKADFGVATNKAHGLYVSKSEDMADMKKAEKATFGDTTITMTQSALNVLALDFAAAGEEVDMYFAVVATLSTDKGAAVPGTELQSNVVKATFKTYVADILPTDKFDKVWVIGNYCGWAHDKTQFLFDYNSTGTTYSGVVDFAGADGVSMAADGFKLTGIAGWDDSCNWGEETKAEAADEPASVQLITGGGSQDIKRYAKRFYGFEFDKTTLVLKKSWGADQIGIIGLNGDWTTDIVMEYNPKWTRFYADVDITADCTMKFRADAAWDLNWGAAAFGLEGDADGNIKVTAGKYRVYFNPVAGILEFNAKNYGTEEDTANGGGTTPEPEGPVTEPDRWGVVGTITEWGGQADLYMSEVGENLYVRMGVTVTDADQFKVRFNNGWDINYGAAGEVEPFAVTVGEELALTAGGKNLSAPAGTYDIYFNVVDFKIWVMPQGETPGGVEVKTVKIYVDVTATNWTECSIWAWDNDANYTGGTWPGELLSKDGDNYVWNVPADALGKTINVIFNNNNNGEQTADINGVVMDQDHYFVVNADFSYTMDGETPIEPEKPAETTYGLIGEFNGWGADIDLVARGDGWYVTEGLAVTAGKLLIRLNDAWDEKFGNDGSTLVIGENTLTYGGADMLIEAGTYDFYFNPSSSKLFLVNAGDEDPTAGGAADVWTIKGDVNNTQWNNGEVATELVDGFYVAKNVTFQDSWNEGANFKVLKNGTWMGSTAGGTHNVGDAIAVSDGGSNITMNVTLDTPYDIYIDGANNNVYVVEAGATPAI